MTGKKGAKWTYISCPNGCGMTTRPGALSRHVSVCGKTYSVEDILKYGDVDSSVGVDACWLWRGSTYTGGYGSFTRESAHRAMYRAVHGGIAPRMEICHSCDNPPCVNPSHLWMGTPKQNRRDAIAKGRLVPSFLDPTVRAIAQSRLPRGADHLLRQNPAKARVQVDSMLVGRVAAGQIPPRVGEVASSDS
jgi:hypothetical protein